MVPHNVRAFDNDVTFILLNNKTAQMETQNRPNKLCFDLSAEDIAKLADQLIEQSKKRLDQIAAVTDPTWANCIQALADEEAEFATLSSMCTFPSQVSALKE